MAFPEDKKYQHFAAVGIVLGSMLLLIFWIAFMGSGVFLPYTVSKNGTLINETEWTNPEVIVVWSVSLYISLVGTILCITFGMAFITLVIYTYVRARPTGQQDVAPRTLGILMMSTLVVFSFMLFVSWIGILSAGFALISEPSIDNATLADMIDTTMNVTENTDWSVDIEQEIGYTYIYVTMALLLIAILSNGLLFSILLYPRFQCHKQESAIEVQRPQENSATEEQRPNSFSFLDKITPEPSNSHLLWQQGSTPEPLNCHLLWQQGKEGVGRVFMDKRL